MAEAVSTDPNLSARVRALVNRSSIAAVARKLRLAEATVARLAGGLKVTAGTELLATQRIGQLERGAA
jgi:hypothetical protein